MLVTPLARASHRKERWSPAQELRGRAGDERNLADRACVVSTTSEVVSIDVFVRCHERRCRGAFPAQRVAFDSRAHLRAPTECLQIIRILDVCACFIVDREPSGRHRVIPLLSLFNRDGDETMQPETPEIGPAWRRAFPRVDSIWATSMLIDDPVPPSI